VEPFVDSLGAFDISAYHATGGVLAKYADLTAALGTNGANIPEALRKGGMSVKYVQSSDNKYVQYRLMSDTFNTVPTNWQGVDDEPAAGSDNLVKSGGVEKSIKELSNLYPPTSDSSQSEDLSFSDDFGNKLVLFSGGHLKTKNFDSRDVTELKSEIVNKVESQNGLSNVDLDFSDEDKNVILRLENGDIKTKNFDSKHVTDRLRELNTPYDLFSIPGLEYALAAQKYVHGWGPTNNYPYAVLVHLTDVHGDSKRFENACRLAKYLNADCVCNTGDTVFADGNNSISFVEEFIDKDKYVECLGNHDAYLYSTNEAVYNKHFDYLKNHIVLDDNTTYPTYGYKDLTDKKIRIIFLNQYDSDVTGLTVPHGYCTISQNQVDFLVSALENTPSDYGVIIMSHSPEKGSIERDTTYNKFYYTQGDRAAVNQLGECWLIRYIVDKFINRGVINNESYSAEHFSVTISADFSNVDNSVEFIMLMNGHTHIDFVGYAKGKNLDGTDATTNILQCNEICTNTWMNLSSTPRFNEGNDLGRQENTVVENAFNVYVIDRTNHNVKIIRVGSQITTTDLSRRDCMVIPYINN
jgi:hypothetical protein